jgi:hypothetical protein
MSSASGTQGSGNGSAKRAPALEELWSALQAAGPGLFLMRGTLAVPGAWSARGTDLDVLADRPSDLEAASSLLLSRGFTREWAPEGYRRRFCLRRLGEHLVNVDLYEAPYWGPGLEAVEPARSLSTAHATLLRAVFDKHDLNYFHSRCRIEELPPELQSSVARAAPRGRAGAGFVAAVLLVQRQVRPVPNAIKASVHQRLQRLTHGAPGIEVAVAGPDGSGKTTLVRNLTEGCPLPFEVVYMGGRGWRTALMRRVAGKSGSTIPRHIEQALRRWQGFRASRAGKVVLYERHPHEIEPSSGHPLMLVAARALFATYRRPVDLGVVLTGDTERMFARKGEHSPAHLRMLDERLRRISATYSRELLTFDSTTLAPELITEQVAAALIARYQRLNRG